MPTSKHARALDKDEELGKRDDDFRPRGRSGTVSGLGGWRVRRRRSILLLIALIIVGGLFWRRYTADPIEDVYVEDPRPWRYDGAIPIPSLSTARTKPPAALSTGFASVDCGKKEKECMREYDGPIELPHMRTSLRAVAKMMGLGQYSQSILFAAASLRSAANILPLACETARQGKVDVHFALLGRDSLSVKDVLQLNGILREDCPARFHDGRADHSSRSSARRFKRSINIALDLAAAYLAPQVVVIDDAANEEENFVQALRSYYGKHKKTVIEVPANRYEDFFWLANLDATSLASWHKPTIEIIVDIPSGTSGSVIRLLKSLRRAQYVGLRVPRLTIQSPAIVEPSLKSFLRGFDWPPTQAHALPGQQLLSLKTRISSQPLSAKGVVQRFLESFHPSNKDDNHVLVLSTDAELHPMYLYYLHYTILGYGYSALGRYTSPSIDDVLGVSLDSPYDISHLRSQLASSASSNNASAQSASSSATLFKSPATILQSGFSSTSAVLIFGDKWMILRDFVQNRWKAMSANLVNSSSKSSSRPAPSLWMGYMDEIAQLRGWMTLLPAFPFAISHIPPRRPKSLPKLDQSHETDVDKQSKGNLNRIQFQRARALHYILPSIRNDSMSLHARPILNRSGRGILLGEHLDATDSYVLDFRRDVGGCASTGDIDGVDYYGENGGATRDSTRGYFCWKDDKSDGT